MDCSFAKTRHVKCKHLLVSVWPLIFAGSDSKDNKFTGHGLLLRVFDPRTHLILNAADKGVSAHLLAPFK